AAMAVAGVIVLSVGRGSARRLPGDDSPPPG
ncbi:MAG: hypothetical protein JWQ60_3861, partial [Pseudonocardia sp.]|nr:hypothetical protein [Pseudonocardia sp.]